MFLSSQRNICGRKGAIWGLKRVLKAQLTDKTVYCNSFPNLLHTAPTALFILLTLRTYFFFSLPYQKANHRLYLILKSRDVNWVENGNDASNSVLSTRLILLSGHLSAPASQNRGLNTYFSVLHPACPLTHYQWYITQWLEYESHNISSCSISE